MTLGILHQAVQQSVAGEEVVGLMACSSHLCFFPMGFSFLWGGGDFLTIAVKGKIYKSIKKETKSATELN